MFVYIPNIEAVMITETIGIDNIDIANAKILTSFAVLVFVFIVFISFEF